MRRLLLSLAVASIGIPVMACQCISQTTFCTTLNAPEEHPEWWTPDAIFLGVKTGESFYGVDMMALQVLHGDITPGEMVFAWGDCGFACRLYPDTWAVGDTVLWALQRTDLQGNFVCGTELEDPDDYMISICGVYWLPYSKGKVSGAIVSEDGTDEMTLGELATLIEGCLPNGIAEASAPALGVRYDADGPVVTFPGQSLLQASVSDVQGRAVVTRSWDGSPWPLRGLAEGTYLVQVQRGGQRWTHKVVIGR